MDNLLWLVQDDLFTENRRADLVEALERFGLNYLRVRIPKDDLEPAVTHEGPIITNGSVKLSRLAAENNWQPGGLINDHFSYTVWFEHFKDFLLNREAIFSTLAEANPPWVEFFIRPLLDTKIFNGHVRKRADFHQWRDSVNQNVMVLCAPVRPIGQEYRHYVVDQRVVTSSRYRLGGTISYSPQVDQHIVDFAQNMCGWQPARAWVLDTYVSGDEQGVVELGCIGNAGLYACDIQKLVMALSEMAVS